MRLRMRTAGGLTPHGVAASAGQCRSQYARISDNTAYLGSTKRSYHETLLSPTHHSSQHTRSLSPRFRRQGLHFTRQCFSHGSGNPKASDNFDDFDSLDDFDSGERKDMFSDLRTMMHDKEKAKKIRRPVGLTSGTDPEMVRARKREEAAMPYILAAEAERRKRITKRILDAKYAEPDRKLRACVNELMSIKEERDRATETFLSAKYAEVEGRLTACATELRSMNDKYQRLKSVLKKLDAEYQRLRFLHELEMVELNTERFSGSFRSLANELQEDFIEPRARARRSIDDKLLSEMKMIAERYLTNQELVGKVTSVARSIIAILDDLSVVPERRESYKAFKNGQLALNYATAMAAHKFRTTYRVRSCSEGPFGPAHYFELLKYYGGASRAAPIPRKMLISMQSLINHKRPTINKRRWPCRRGGLLLVDLAQRFYRPRLKQTHFLLPRSPRLNIFWRQLDIIAPFETLRASTNANSSEIRLLIEALRHPSPGLWSNLDVQARMRHVTNLDTCWYKFRQSHTDTTSDYQFLRSITWKRLQLESKIHSYGDTAPTLQSKLFTPAAPLSQDVSRFERWLFQLNDLHIQAMELAALAPKQKSLCKDLFSSQYQDMVQEPQEIDTQFILGPVEEPTIEPEPMHITMMRRSRIVRRVPGVTSVTPTKTAVSKRHVKRLPGSSTSSSHKFKRSTERRPHLSQKGDRPARRQPATDSSTRQVSEKKQSKSEPLKRRDTEPGETSRKRSSRKRGHDSASSNDPPQSQKTLSPKKRESTKPGASRPCDSGTPIPRPVLSSSPRREYSTVSNSSRNSPNDEEPKATDCSTTKSSEYASMTLECPEALFVDSERGNIDVSGTEATSQDMRASQSCSQEGRERSIDGPYPQFWSHNMRTEPQGNGVLVHYCKTLDSAERIASQFLDSDVVGFDIEWKAQASASDSIQNNVSLIQIANEERIALFQVALFRPGKLLEDLVVPSLKKLLESAKIMKVGVSIKADSTRVRRYLGINVQSQLELSHLYKLVKYAQSDPKLINKRAVNLSSQVEEHLGLPLNKDDDVRCSDWTRSLDYRQVQYAAVDPYACLRLYRVMEAKRRAMNPTPPRPAYAELGLPILLADGKPVAVQGDSFDAEDQDPQSSSVPEDLPVGPLQSHA